MSQSIPGQLSDTMAPSRIICKVFDYFNHDQFTIQAVNAIRSRLGSLLPCLYPVLHTEYGYNLAISRPMVDTLVDLGLGI